VDACERILIKLGVTWEKEYSVKLGVAWGKNT